MSKDVSVEPKDIKREVVSETPWNEVVDGQTIEGADTIETEIESTHLIKIAPLLYLCEDNNKVYLIPFTLEFSQQQFLEYVSKQAIALETYYSLKESK